MAKQVTIKGFVYEMDFGTGGKDYSFFRSADQGDDWYTIIGPAELQYEIPDSFNPTAAKLAALEEQKAAVRAAYLSKLREIEERISKLQAIEFVEA